MRAERRGGRRGAMRRARGANEVRALVRVETVEATADAMVAVEHTHLPERDEKV